MASARGVLGIRSEKEIQNEIRRTEAAYQRLAQSGTASAREQARAYDAMRRKVSDLRSEMGRTSRSADEMVQRMTKGFTAFQAMKYVLRDPVRKSMGYDLDMAYVTNTLYPKSPVSERDAKKKDINAAIMNSIRIAGGGTRDDAMAAVRTMAASGEFGDNPQEAMNALPEIMRASLANNASPIDMANVVIKAKQNMGLTNYKRILGMATQGGIEGQFETSDMAPWLPQQMAYAGRSGLTGESGYATLIAMNQMAMRTAGTADEAGNNVRNFVAKINSSDTAADFKKLNIDLPGRLAADKARGINGVDSFLNLITEQQDKDPRIAALRARAKGAKGEEMQSNLQEQIKIIEGSALGKVLQDMQATGAVTATLSDRGRFDEIRRNTLGERDAVGNLLPLITDTASAKAQVAEANKADATQTAINKFLPLVGWAADGFSNLAEKFSFCYGKCNGGWYGGGGNCCGIGGV